MKNVAPIFTQVRAQICARGAQQLFWRCALLAFLRCFATLAPPINDATIVNVGHGQYNIFILRNLLYLLRSIRLTS